MIATAPPFPIDPDTVRLRSVNGEHSMGPFACRRLDAAWPHEGATQATLAGLAAFVRGRAMEQWMDTNMFTGRWVWNTNGPLLGSFFANTQDGKAVISWPNTTIISRHLRWGPGHHGWAQGIEGKKILETVTLDLVCHTMSAHQRLAFWRWAKEGL